ncbi:MAG: methylated-DNA--[protein]-cysteine S-methyltransferase [Deltaproteobacteria bacterium]|nr:methylated-DNA--[protein]-cysteine S-methyltransferase [Deltaproteobacteria bacterium]
MLIWNCRLPSPVGPITVGFSQEGVTRLEFGPEGEEAAIPACTDAPQPWMGDIIRALGDYFAGRPIDSRGLRLHLAGTPFQLRVWHELAAVPWGQTVSYGELARRAGYRGASRAVGRACGQNPIPIIIPCHRVIRADGSPGGFSAGLERKLWLLAHES